MMKLFNLLCALSGDDFSIIVKCNKVTQRQFAVIGFLVLIIFVLCFASALYAFSKLFQNYFIGIPLAVFFSWMLTNIYLLLLYTLTKNVLPHQDKVRGRNISIAFRMLFICFISIIVSKPLETLMFKNTLSLELAQYRSEQVSKYVEITNNYFDQETAQLRSIMEKQNALQLENIHDLGSTYLEMISKNEAKRNLSIKRMQALVANSNYFIQSIVILDQKYPVCWFLTLFVTLIFILPAYFKKKVGESSLYYEAKRMIEMKLISEEYASFKSRYNLIFQTKFHRNVLYTESFVDAPFNTIRKIDSTVYLDEDDLRRELYNA